MTKLFNLYFSLGTREDFARQLLLQRRKRVLILPTTANEIIQARLSPRFKRMLRRFDYLVTDGMPLVWLARLIESKAERVYGPDLMLTVLEKGQHKGVTHYFYGTTEETLSRLRKAILKRFPKVRVVGWYAPPFRPLTAKEEQMVAKQINTVKPDFVWVGLGGIKQVEWSVKMKHRLQVKAIIPVGAAFDFIAGIKPQAPRWLQQLGLEWLFRLVSEPRRLWRRYVLQIPLFLVIWVTEAMRLMLYRLKKME